jgi:Protein of unknown function (DUF1592)/Protein of unknown function (DUF1588)/Protein of unknown function (DUF1585)/Protein of unknown function (DUF1595)
MLVFFEGGGGANSSKLTASLIFPGAGVEPVPLGRNFLVERHPNGVNAMTFANMTRFPRALGAKGCLALLGSLALLAGCGGGTDSSGPVGPNPGATGGSGAGGSPGSAGVGAGAGAAGSEGGLPPDGPCVQGVPMTTQIPRMLNRQYANVVRDLLGVTAIDGAPVASALFGDFTGPMTAPAWQIYQDVAAKIAAQVMAGPNKAQFISCDPAAAGCLKTTIETFGRKAFRRALTAAEVTSFERLSKTTPAGTPAEVAEATLHAFLVSPSFLLIPEINTEVEGTAIKLSPQEVATRLSFLLWGSVPDPVLDAAADANELQTKEQILAQAQRMIAVRERTGPLVAAFHNEWAQVNSGSGHWFKIDHDVAKYPTYDAAAKPSFRKEMDAFFEEVAFTNGSFQDLLTSKVAFVNKDNAGIYGLDPAMYGTDLTKVSLDSADMPRPGFLTRAGFLSSYSNYDASSPILRGAFIAVSLMNLNPGAPIAGAADAKVEGTFLTQRAYVEALTEKTQPCQGCHQQINPIGYVLENYDGIGKWQTTDLRGGPIDASVTTANINFGDAGVKPISSPTQLMEEIAKLPKAQELYAKAWVSYAFGRPANANDQCTVDQLKTKLTGSGYSILSLLGDLTQADSFRVRVRGTP